MRGISKKLAGRIFLVLTAIVVSALYPVVSFTLAEQPIFRGDSASGVTQKTFIIDENNQSGDLKLQFGQTLDEYIKWNDTTSKFQISNNLDLLGNLNLMGNEISDFRVENIPADPTCDIGRLYFNTTDNHGYMCNGTDWIRIDDEWVLESGVLHPNLTTTKVAIGTISAASPLHVYENDVFTNASAGLTIEQDGTGDALLQFVLTGLKRWVVGIDQSDGYNFRIGTAAAEPGYSVKIGAGGAGSSTPLLFGLDVKSDNGTDPTGYDGAMYYNTFSDKFRCYQGGFWKDCVGDLDSVFANDADKKLNVDNSDHLIIDLKNSKDFIIQDDTVPFATFANDGSISLGKGSTSTTINIGNGTGTDTINIGTGGADVVNLGTGTAQKTISIGSSSTATTSVNVLSGSTGGIKLRPAGDNASGTVQVGEDATTTAPDLLRLGLKSNTGDPSGAAGMMFYNSSNNKFRCYQGGTWTDCVENKVVLASDVVDSSGSCTITNVTGLAFPVVSGRIYHFRFVIDYTSASTNTGSRWTISGPSTTRLAYTSHYALSATTNTFNNASAYDTPAGCNANSLTAGNIAVIEGMITPSASGNVTARFASEVNGSAITAKAGSYVEWW